MRKTVFLDRDGLINKRAPLHEYITIWEQFEFLANAPQAIKRLNDAGYLVIVVSNQRGVAHGIMTIEDVESVNSIMCHELAKIGAHIDGLYICPHEEGTCNCRKPDIGLFIMAERDFEIDKCASWMIGDSESDVQAGMKYGVRSIMTVDLAFAVDRILGEDI